MTNFFKPCPGCGRKMYKNNRHETCSSCTYLNYNPRTKKSSGYYCQYVGCPNRLKEVLPEETVTEGEFTFCTIYCKEKFIETREAVWKH